MGMHLSEILSSFGHDVSVTSRSARIDSEKIRYIKGNARNENFLNEVLSVGWDVVVDFMIYTTEEFAKYVSRLLDSTKHYVFLSSARVYANSESPISESSPRLLETVQDSRQHICERQAPAASCYLSTHCAEQLHEPAAQPAKAGQPKHQ